SSGVGHNDPAHPAERFDQTILLRHLLHRFVGLLFRFGNEAGGGHAVVLFHFDQADSLSRAARLADFARIDADHFAVAGDDHQLGIFLHREDADHFAGLRGRLHIDDALYAAVGETVILHLRPLAVAVLGDGEDETAFDDHFRADDEILLGKIHATHAARGAAHRADVVFGEADRLAVMRAEEDEILARSAAGRDQLIAFVEAERDDAARHRIAEFGDRALLDHAVLRHHDDIGIAFK